MRKIILIIVLVWACVIKTDASVNLNQFSIQSGFLQEGKLKPSTSGATTFNVDFWFSQVGSSNNTVKATVIYREGNIDTELMTGIWRFEGDWITSGSTVWQLYSISAVLPAGKTAGKIYLKYETGTGSTLAATFYSSTSYDIYTASTHPNPDPGPRLEDAPVGVPPAFTAPEVGSVPLYEYVSGNRRRLTTVYYMTSSYPEFTYNGIVGYVFTSATTGTVPLYRYIHPSNGNYYYTITLTTTSGYTYDGVACYVHQNQVSNVFPVYENYSGSLGSFHRYSNSPDIFPSYKFEGVKFYILQNLTPIPIYQYYHGVSHDHYASPEMDATVGFFGWQSLGVDFKAYKIQAPGTIPVHLFYTDVDVDHFISTDRNATNGYANWEYRGISFYAYSTQVPGTIPIYLHGYNGGSVNHYTTSHPNIHLEYPDWSRVGVAFYAYPAN